MSEPLDNKLYNKVKEDAKKKFKRFPSLYASAWISREYKKRGGKYKGKKPKETNISKWFKEEWVQIIPFVKDNKKIICGDKNKLTKACRPTKKIDSKTPLTMKEIIKLHGKEKVLKLAGQKNRDMKGRLNWKSGTFKNSK
jgi:hypothetical protein